MIMKRLLTLLALLLGLSLSAFAQTQSKLPPCPPVDYSKSTHAGLGGRTEKWHNCYGRYVAELNDASKGTVFEGEHRNGLPNGQGTLTFPDGEKYVGDWKDGKYHGQGSYTYADGAKYVGKWKDDKKNGQGTHILAEGAKYVGEYKDDKYNGLGTFTFADGGKYVGEFKDGKWHGKGTLIYSDGEVLQEGIWADNEFVRAEKVNLPSVNKQTGVANNEERRKLDADRQVQSKLPPCPKDTNPKWSNCFGAYTTPNGAKYVGEFKDGKYNGQGTFTMTNGGKYVGEFRNGLIDGQGIFTDSNGTSYTGEYKDFKRHGKGFMTYPDGSTAKEGIWADDKFVRAEKINLPPVNQQTDVAINEERRRLDADRQALEVDRQRLAEERNRREQSKQTSKLSLQTTTTNPDANGVVIISVRTNADTSSLKVNGNEEGSKVDGNYTIKRVARVSQDTNYTIVATDVFGNTASTTITVARQAVSPSSNQTASLKPENIKRAASRDAVAIIIGIQNYKRVPKAEFANSDAKEFYEYAIRGLGIKPENIKLLVDEEADEVNIVKAFRNWLPLQVNKNKTDVYVFYSGHGLPSPDGQSLYFLPHGVDEELLERTAVGQKEVVALLTASKPKSVTMFIDACYSGKARGGETLLASAKPIALKTDTNVFPSNFTVITASANDQISSSSPELKHGIFSFYLMKGMEGDADANKDGKITAGEMLEYLQDKVSRQAMSMSRKQDTQLVGDANRVLMGVR
jgi:hypothetical protein